MSKTMSLEAFIMAGLALGAAIGKILDPASGLDPLMLLVCFYLVRIATALEKEK